EEVWYVDLAEWELDGDPGLIGAGILADRRFPDYVRRHALLLALELAEARSQVQAAQVVKRLHSIRAYPVIAALERLYSTGDSEVKIAVVGALGKLRFKRSFGVVTRALRDDDPRLRRAAREAVHRLYFPHAFDRLRGIFEARDLPDAVEARQ